MPVFFSPDSLYAEDLCFPQETGKSVDDYSKSTIVQTSAPTAMGQLRAADGKEGFTAAAKNAAQSIAQSASNLVNGSSWLSGNLEYLASGWVEQSLKVTVLECALSAK